MMLGLFNNDVFICLSVVEDGGMISSASAKAPAAVVDDDVMVSLLVAAFLMTADAWLTLPVCMIVLLSVADADVAGSCIISEWCPPPVVMLLVFDLLSSATSMLRDC